MWSKSTLKLVIHSLVIAVDGVVGRSVILVGRRRSGTTSRGPWLRFGATHRPTAGTTGTVGGLTPTPGSWFAVVFVVTLRRLWPRLRARSRLRSRASRSRSRPGFASASGLWTSARSRTGSRPRPTPPTSLVFHHFDASPVQISSVQFVQGVLHIGIGSKIYNSHIPLPFVCVRIRHFAGLSHEIFEILWIQVIWD